MYSFETKVSRDNYAQVISTLPAGTAPSSLLFFDIETTGLSPASAQIYLIGALSFSGAGDAVLHQWFADSLSEEQALLRSFFAFAAPFATLVHFNGARFDLPFLTQCSAQYHLPCPLTEKQSLDFYAAVSPYRALFAGERLTQRALEARLDLTREDPFTGAELIETYSLWQRTHDEALLQALRTHNAADVIALPSLLPLLTIPAFFHGTFQDLILTREETVARLSARSETALPFPLSLEKETFSLQAEGNTLAVTLPLLTDTLFHYWKDYRNYYILKEDGSLLHKSLASFVDAAAKEKATRDTARQPKYDAFLALPARMKPKQPCFQRTARSTPLYLPFSDFAATPALCSEYLNTLLSFLSLRK